MTADAPAPTIENADQAEALLRRSAWTEGPDEEKIAEILAAAAPTDTVAQVRERIPKPRTRIHSWRGGFGADWDLEPAIEFVRREGTEFHYRRGLFGWGLTVQVGDDRVVFDVANPDGTFE
jgi:hypothetical protein